MALVLAPSTPAPLAVRTLDWYQDPDLNRRVAAAAAAVLQLLICLAGIGVMMLIEHLARYGGRVVARWGHRKPRLRRRLATLLPFVIALGGVVPLAIAVLGMAAALLWSVAAVWRFPDSLPGGLTLRYWMGLTGDLGIITLQSMLLGMVSSALAVVLAVIWLEHRRPPGAGFEKMIFLPLLVPQIGFLLACRWCCCGWVLMA